MLGTQRTGHYNKPDSPLGMSLAQRQCRILCLAEASVCWFEHIGETFDLVSECNQTL